MALAQFGAGSFENIASTAAADCCWTIDSGCGGAIAIVGRAALSTCAEDGIGCCGNGGGGNAATVGSAAASGAGRPGCGGTPGKDRGRLGSGWTFITCGCCASDCASGGADSGLPRGGRSGRSSVMSIGPDGIFTALRTAVPGPGLRSGGIPVSSSSITSLSSSTSISTVGVFFDIAAGAGAARLFAGLTAPRPPPPRTVAPVAGGGATRSSKSRSSSSSTPSTSGSTSTVPDLSPTASTSGDGVGSRWIIAACGMTAERRSETRFSPEIDVGFVKLSEASWPGSPL